MSEQKKPVKIEFAPGAFDSFDGTQEELDEMMKEIHRMFESGEFIEKAIPLDLDSLDPEERAIIEARLDEIVFDENDNISTSTVRKNLH